MGPLNSVIVVGREHGITSDGFFELEDLPKKVQRVSTYWLSRARSAFLRFVSSSA
jgi:hypothetical protein